MYLLAVAADAGPSWPQLLTAIGLGSVLSAIVTGLFLMIQTRMTNERERTRLESEGEQREKDREATATASERARHDALDDHWREERRQAHAHLVSLLEAAMAHMDSARNRAVRESKEPEADEVTFAESLSIAQRKEIQGAFAQIQILGSTHSRTTGNLAMSKILSYDGLMSFTTEWPGGPSTEHSREMTECHHALLDYIAAVRVDLGTDA